MKINLNLSCLCALSLILGIAAGCGGDDSNENNGDGGGSSSMTVDLGKSVNRSGPQSLAGFTWRFDPIEVNGFLLQPGFQFTQDMVIAQNTCNNTETVMTSAPVEYSYNAEITQDAYKKEGTGDDTCEVSISKSSFDFKIEGGNLVATADGQTLTFTPQGTTSGLYGTWAYTENDLTIRWSIGNGVIRAEADCTKLNGLVARTEAPATFKNFVEITMPAMEDSGTCQVSIMESTIQYYFDGDALVFVYASGQEQRLSK